MTYKKLIAPVAAAALAFGLVACSGDDAKDSATKATDTVSSAAAQASSAVTAPGADNSAAPSEGAEGAQGAEGAEGAQAEMVDVATADGQTVQVPAAIQSAAQQNPVAYTSLLSVQKGPQGEFLAEYPNMEYIAYTAQTGAQPIRGSISEVWIGQGGFNSPLGAPVAEETVLPNNAGWSQNFAHGVINWTKDAAGQYQADIQAS
ncbi:LGFP repeat-containing protein [Corynebacterium uberis]|uniref:LGFP repeat-containing protein n=1 Tax=Corynebacterium TaxID=1716 RepID=UPI001D0B1CE5|nr:MULTISPECIES: hypothetical protein [Corynebacterium]MCZ9308885.1 hypothetical protein [Corynebacterium sp. c6VSa_13]UDL74639.1 hypothetical protein LH391_05490 [Corynebacterium uberis]UDL76527.1 hypothetical protein LH393_03915 [Corynebacterium uberis]UDL78739.1 hypothetical protein LH394_03900 [Corynebacterium uberis]UDL81018.1 hypothetical protein LH392_04325 [Corynebacterium uberis]